MDNYATRLDIEEKHGCMLRIGMNRHRIERYTFRGRHEMGYGRIRWTAAVVTNDGSFLIAEGLNHDQILEKMYEFIGTVREVGYEA